MARCSELSVDKLLVWYTEIPFEDKPLRSPNFSLMGSEWYLQFCFNSGRIGCFHGFHVLYLHRVTVEDGPQLIEFKARTYVTDPTELGGGEKNVMNETIQQPEKRLWYSGNSKEDIFKTFPALYQTGKVKFVCKFYGQPQSAFQLGIGTDPLTTSETTSRESVEGPSDLECLSGDLGRLLEGEQLPDVHLNCGGRTFPAHRSVLAARSEVFAAMFRNKMAESETGGVDVKDFDPDVVQHFLQYLYTGKLTAESGDAVASLCAIADKYAVESLKMACTRWIVSNLTEENCIQYLTVADLHGSDALKKETMDFICRHQALMLSEEWAQLSEKNPKLALEVHHSFVLSKTEM